MNDRLPTYKTTLKALEPSVRKSGGIQKLSGGFYAWNCIDPRDNKYPSIYMPITLREFVQCRISALIGMLEELNISFVDVSSSELIQRVRSQSSDIVSNVPDIWQGRFKTCTAMYRAENGYMHYIDAPHLFASQGRLLDYDSISDGGVKVLEKPQEKPYGSLSWREYLAAQGGSKTIQELDRHPIVQALLPDREMRREYLVALSFFDMTGSDELGKQSIWSPREIQPGYLRWFDLGNKGTAFYPANLTTSFHRLILRKKVSSAES